MSVTQVAASSSPPAPPPLQPPPPPPAAAVVHGRLLPNLAAAMDTDPSPSPARPRSLSGGDTFAFPNGTLKRHNPARPRSPPPSPPGYYRECLKNHAASLGGHALDGCGEFMPSPLAVPSDPSSLKCAACGCHRNFHRRDDDPASAADDPAAGDLAPKRRSSSSASPPRPQPPLPISSPYFTSAPHMLLALSTGAGPAQSATPIGRKRFRTKFSREQKEKMLLFADKLGWRMQKQEEKLVEDFCNEIGVAKGVLKVWMHNNKHTFVKKDQRQQVLHGNGNGSFNNESPNGFDNNKTNGTTTTSHVFNGSSSSS